MLAILVESFFSSNSERWQVQGQLPFESRYATCWVIEPSLPFVTLVFLICKAGTVIVGLP